MAGSVILSVRDLRVEFPSKEGPRAVVDGIHFDLRSGQTLGLVGESGSGKTMTALALMGFIPFVHKEAKVSGSIRLFGEELGAYTQAQWRGLRGSTIAMIFQEPMSAMNPVFRCGQQLLEALPANLSKQERKAQALSLLERVQLREPERIFRSYPHECSGGQLQRVLIAQALAGNPRILLADEPTTALDVTIQAEILSLIKHLQKELDLAILFISHDLGVIAELAEEVVVLQNGQVVEQQPVEALFASPKAPYTKGLLACRPPLDSRPARLPLLKDFLEGTVAASSSFEAKTPGEPSSGGDLVRVQALYKYYRKKNFLGKTMNLVKAVDNVSFNIPKGKTVGLVGESGSGKTTLGMNILQLSRPDAGQVLFDGVDLTKLEGAELRRMRPQFQMIFQDPYASLNPRRTIGEALMEPLRVHGKERNQKVLRDQAVELLEQVHLKAEHLERMPDAFSGGQRQRICIARALATKPRLLVCDECVSALDVSIQAEILNLLADLRDELGLTLLFISHDLSVVRFISDQVVVLQDGQIVEQGETERLFERPAHPYTKRLLEAIPKGR